MTTGERVSLADSKVGLAFSIIGAALSIAMSYVTVAVYLACSNKLSEDEGAEPIAD